MNRPIEGIDIDGLEFFSRRTANGWLLEAEFKVVNSSKILTDEQARALIPLLKAQFIESYSAISEKGTVYSAAANFSFVPGSRLDRSKDYYIDLVDLPEGVTYAGRRTSDHSAEVGVTEFEPFWSEKIELRDVPGGIPEQISTMVKTMIQSLIPFKDIKRTGAHEMGHVGGLEHVFSFLGNLVDVSTDSGIKLAPGLRALANQSVQDLLDGQRESTAINKIKFNLMNSEGNPIDLLKSNSGGMLEINQIIKMHRNANSREKNEK
jgi:hypothetical protein